MSESKREASGDRQRLDKWLMYARFYKTRSLASAAVCGGKVHLNAERIKPSHPVRIGDRITISMQGVVGEFQILGLPLRRGPAAEAAAQYVETEASAVRREMLRAQQRLALAARPRPDTRPDKRDRRRLMRLHRDQT